MDATMIAVVSITVMVAVTGYLIASLLYSIHSEKRSQNLRKTWKNFGLSSRSVLFF